MIASHYIAHFVLNRISPNGKQEEKKMKLSHALKYQSSDRISFNQIGKIFFLSSLCAVKLLIQYFDVGKTNYNFNR